MDSISTPNFSEEYKESDMLLSHSDIRKLTDLYFMQNNVLYNHSLGSFNKMVHTIMELLSSDKLSFNEKTSIMEFDGIEENVYIVNKLKFDNIVVQPPLNEDNMPLFPNEARIRNLSYNIVFKADITQIQEITIVSTNEKLINQVGNTEYEFPVMTLPCMVKSAYCNLTLRKEEIDNTKPFKSDCKFDPGCYFIIKGNEKLVICQEKLCDNKPFVFAEKKKNPCPYRVQVTSKSDNPEDDIQPIRIYHNVKDDSLMVHIPFLHEVSLFIVIRALGIESDEMIIKYITEDINDTVMTNRLRNSLFSESNYYKTKRINTQEDAINFLLTKMKVFKREYTESDIEKKALEKRIHLMEMFSKFLPHINSDILHKAYYLCYITRKLLNVVLGRIPVDDRDTFVNKRIETPGDLIFSLINDKFKIVMKSLGDSFRKNSTDDYNPIQIIRNFNSKPIEQQVTQSLSLGTFPVNKTGVAMNHFMKTFIEPIEYYRKISSPSSSSNLNKTTAPRHVQPSQIGFVCVVATPEGKSVGLAKAMTLMASITLMRRTQIQLIKNFFREKLINIQDIPVDNMRHYTKVFLNGEWLGITDLPIELYEELYEMKLTNMIEMTTGIILKYRENEIHVYCDSGRLYRPVLRVKDNRILLTKEMINSIDTNTKWNHFILDNPGVIEYIDMEEMPYYMISQRQKEVEIERQKMIQSSELINKMSSEMMTNVINRYDETTFLKFTHCELNPALLLATTAIGIPFSDHNQSPRNMYQWNQRKQACGINSTNFYNRLDQTYLLYNTQKPIVYNYADKYTNVDRMPSGENCIVALACYTGFNQEDSVILNQSAIDMGFFNSSTYDRYISIIQKNQITSGNEKFMKPDIETVEGLRNASHEKLDDDGFIKEETEIVNGDVLIGKVTPLNEMNAKRYRDNSEIYKESAPGVVDRVYKNIKNSEGYPMGKVKTRSERIPKIGDKFCTRAGQKGTVGITLPASKMPYTENGITPDIIMNPNAIPSRMTIGQILECITGKLSTINGVETDTSPFQELDMEQLYSELREAGFEDNGTETLYSGITGKPMKVKIFVGPTYYMRLKHMVADKQYARARGSMQSLTRLPPNGRANEGGLRFGEMERDAMIAHGASQFLKERTMETADKFDTYVCDLCGGFAQRLMVDSQKTFITEKDVYMCKACNNTTEISKITIPYCFKLLMQELIAYSIMPRIRTPKSKYRNVLVGDK